jgi:outer membrane receptor for ferrienterochelin and colicins
MSSPSYRQLTIAVVLLTASTICGRSRADDQAAVDEHLPEIVVSDKILSDLRLREEEVRRVERIRPETLENRQAQTFATMIDGQRGIDTQMSCAFCGSKRITINGLRGEHTTILVDGLSLHSTVSSFYGIEAIPLGGIETIDIYRGSGAALTAPESIGGAINIITSDVVSSGVNGRFSAAHDGQYNLMGTATQRLDERHGVLFAFQHGEIPPVDRDGNLVAELPRQQTFGLTGKYIYRPRRSDELSLRLSYANLQILGGTMERLHLERANTDLVDSNDFLNQDVRQRYLGPQFKIADQVDVERIETALIYQVQLDRQSSFRLGLGIAQQKQDAIYSHGYDYGNFDRVVVAQMEYQVKLGNQHLLKFGVDAKWQNMDSRSEVLFEREESPLPSDDLRYRSVGAYVQDSWFMDDKNTLSAVVRFDHIQTEWLHLENRIDRWMIAPRLIFKHLHNDILTSRLAAGLGYRSPLTLFESQHGTNHYGFIVDVDRLEIAESFVYSLAGQRHDDFFEFSAHITRLNHMAYGLDRADVNEPTLFRNSTESFTINNFDLSYGRRLSAQWDFEGIFESFHYPEAYKRTLPVAAIERRFTLASNYQWNQWKISPRLVWVGARNLSAYLYDRHFNISTIDEDVFSETFGQVDASAPKRQTAPAYWTADLNVDYGLSNAFAVTMSILNITDFTQTDLGDSPTTWHVHGNHYHLDNFHLWGPLRGRQIFAGIRGEF